MNIIPGASLPVPGCTGLYLAIPAIPGYTWLSWPYQAVPQVHHPQGITPCT